MDNIRNFVIVAHIDHGKSTLADRMLEITGAIPERKMKEQVLDQMDLEREKGITIKMAPVRMSYVLNSKSYVLNLIDTPGHVDFTYEVSRALAAVSGAILLVDGTQGVQAQTIANLNLAKAEGLIIIPVINKVDLSNCLIEETKRELRDLLGVSDDEIFLISAKTGKGVAELLKAAVSRVPPPAGDVSRPFKALIFDSVFDSYRGVIAHVRIVDGSVRKGEKIKTLQTGAEAECLEVGWFSPSLSPQSELKAGEIGYIATGVKEPSNIKVGDTIAGRGSEVSPLSGYREPAPNVFSAVFPENVDDFEILKEALSKLKLNDASLTFELRSSEALGRGFLVGFLGLLHMEIVSERLRREYGLNLIFSSPSVSYKITAKNGGEEVIYSASQAPDDVGSSGISISEPFTDLEIISPKRYLGAVMKLLERRRSFYKNTEYLGGDSAVLKYELPLSEVITDLYDNLKSVSQGYASMSYRIGGYRPADLVKMNVLVAGEPVEAFARVVPRAGAYGEGKKTVEKLKELLPRQLFAVSLQAAIGGKVVARENISALKKDVAGYLYGGDRTRKMKLWKKQKRGKERLKGRGKVEIPSEVFLKMIKI